MAGDEASEFAQPERAHLSIRPRRPGAQASFLQPGSPSSKEKDTMQDLEKRPLPLTIVLTAIALLAFAGNALFARAALSSAAIDATAFTLARIVSGAAMLVVLVKIGQRQERFLPMRGNWGAALALVAYASTFAIAYRDLTAASGALLLFAGVQVTMIGYGRLRGERLGAIRGAGLLLALAGVLLLLLPGWEAPPPSAAALMLVAGASWGVYCIRGLGTRDALGSTAGNFFRAVPLALLVWLAFGARIVFSPDGLVFAVLSGAVTSGVGYAVWYAALRGLSSGSAAVLQLSVPVITAVGGALLLEEHVPRRVVLASVAILAGIALVVIRRRDRVSAQRST